jgi:hypothetical protein
MITLVGRMLSIVNDQPTNQPESRPDDQPATDQLDQVEYTLDEAAVRLGITREAVRLRVRRGTLVGTRRNGQWVVRLVAVTADTTDHVTDRPVDQPARRPTKRPTDQPHSHREIARLEQIVAQVEGERDRLVVELEARRREVETLQHQAENYQVLLLRSGAALPSPVVEAQQPTDRTTARQPPWWARLFGRRQG